MPASLPLALVRGICRRHRLVQRREERLEPARGLARRGQLEEVGLGLHDLFVGAHVVAHGARAVRDHCAQPDQRAAHREVMDELRIIARGTGGDGRKLQIDEVFRAAQLLEARDVGHEILHRGGVGRQTLCDAGAGELEDLAVDGVEEMVGLDDVLDAVEHIVGRQDRAQKLLLGLDIVGQDAGGRAVG
jgi:hypothetical protein